MPLKYKVAQNEKESNQTEESQNGCEVMLQRIMGFNPQKWCLQTCMKRKTTEDFLFASLHVVLIRQTVLNAQKKD